MAYDARIDSFFNKFLEAAVGKVTPEQTSAALKKYMDPAKFVVVTAGSFNK